MNNTVKQPPVQQPQKPQEHAGFLFSSSIEILDPESGEVILQQRCD